MAQKPKPLRIIKIALLEYIFKIYYFPPNFCGFVIEFLHLRSGLNKNHQPHQTIS